MGPFADQRKFGLKGSDEEINREVCKFYRIEEHLSLVAVQVTSVWTSSKLDGDCHNIPWATTAFDATRGTYLLTKTSDVLQRIMQ